MSAHCRRSMNSKSHPFPFLFLSLTVYTSSGQSVEASRRRCRLPFWHLPWLCGEWFTGWGWRVVSGKEKRVGGGHTEPVTWWEIWHCGVWGSVLLLPRNVWPQQGSEARGVGTSAAQGPFPKRRCLPSVTCFCAAGHSSCLMPGSLSFCPHCLSIGPKGDY